MYYLLHGEASLEALKINQKRGRLDIKAVINDEKIVDIEVQLQDNTNIKKRISYYGASLKAEDLNQGEDYTNTKPVIMIVILNYNLLDVPEYYTESVIVAKNHREYELTDEFKYYFIELPKFRKQRPDLSDELASWIALINNHKGDDIKMAEEKHEIIKEAKKDLDKVLSDSVLREIAEFEKSAVMEENAKLHYAEEKGITEGRKEGVNAEKIETAKKMIKNGENLEKVILYTGLSRKDILKIKEDLKI